jgi:serralysin
LGVENYVKINPDPTGTWQNSTDSWIPNVDHGIAEIPLQLSINLPTSPTEGAGVFTTTINLSAGTQSAGNLAEGAKVYWKITGITGDDLVSGALTGSGTITNGRLDLQHSLLQDADIGEKFEVSVFSDPLMTSEYQIGSTASVQIQESDSTPPTVASISVQGTTVILKFSEAVTATSVPVNAFAVATVDSKSKVTTRTDSSVALDQNDATQVILSLTGTAPASNVNLRVSYTDPTGNQSTSVVQDAAGNDLASFSNRFADTYITSTTTTLASQYQNLTLTGTSAINGTGNVLANTITGNSANNTLTGLAGNDTLIGESGNDILIGGTGADFLTGGAGTDTFRFALTDSLLPSIDRITDLIIGTDRIDGPSAVTAANLRELGTVSELTQSGIASVLTSSSFVKNGAATFTFGSGVDTRTFLALNNGTAGFASSTDAIVEITGYTGLLTNLAVV